MRSVLLALMALLTCGTANGELVLGTLTWDVDVNDQGFTNQNFTGTATFLFDDASISGSGEEFIQGGLTTFTQSPSAIGTTNFDLSNTSFWLNFTDGSMTFATVGGNPNNPLGVSGSTDDFLVQRDLNHPSGTFEISDATVSGTHIAAINSIQSSFQAVPEPGSLVSFCIAITLVNRRKRVR